MIETSSDLLRSSSDLLRSSSAISGYLREMFGKCSEAFVWPSEQFWKIFGNLLGRKSAENRQKRGH